MVSTAAEIESFVRDFEARTLPASRWTHEAHLLVGLWYLTHHSHDVALALVRQRIRAYKREGYEVIGEQTEIEE